MFLEMLKYKNKNSNEWFLNNLTLNIMILRSTIVNLEDMSAIMNRKSF